MRIDALLCNKGFFVSRNKAKESIERGEIFFNGVKVDKPSLDVPEEFFSKISVKRVATEFVSIGGFKLEKALKDFDLSVKGLFAADVGASTGGFTDCLIKYGAKKVYSVDLNDGLLSDKLRENPAVYPIIKNARYLTKNDFKEDLDLIVADLSFISETLVLPVFADILGANKKAVILIKPQFESDVKVRRKNGIVNDKKEILSAVEKVVLSAVSYGFTPEKLTTAPITSGKNIEFLLLLTRRKADNFYFDDFINKNFSVCK